MSENFFGTIYKGVGGLYFVKPDDGGEHVACRARGRFRAERISPEVGDHCEVARRPDGGGYLVEVLPRASLFERPPVANITRLVIVASAAPPVTDRFMIDRMAALAISKNVEPVLVINKCDIDRADALYNDYLLAGFKVLRVSAETGEGTDELLEILSSGVTAFSGQSGVGKSSLLNRIDSRFSAETGELSEKLGRGRHTTRHVELFDLENGGTVADTPGFSSFDDSEADRITADELEKCFPEFAPFLGECRFSDCSHCTDLGCAVTEALGEGKIAKTRHQSYVKMREKAKLIKPWDKPNK